MALQNDEGGMPYPDTTLPPCIQYECIEDEYEVDWSHNFGLNRNIIPCRHRKSKQEYVVKTVPKSKYSMQELKMLHYCTHHCPMAVTNLIQVYENCLTHSDDQQFKITYHLFILEKMNRGSLFDYISLLEHEYSEHQISKLFQKTVKAVASLHELNIAHRDIKPDNILVHVQGDDVHIKLTDLAFSSFDDGHSLDAECGTLEYQAPETQIDHPRVCRRGGFYTKTCDIWSLGVSLYLLLSGTFPFHGHDVARKLKQDYTFSKELWNDVSTKAQAFVSILLCAPPRLRPTVSIILNHPWLTDSDALSHKDLTRARLRLISSRQSLSSTEASKDKRSSATETQDHKFCSVSPQLKWSSAEIGNEPSLQISLFELGNRDFDVHLHPKSEWNHSAIATNM